MDLACQSKPNKKRRQRKDEHLPDPLPQRKSQRLLAKSQPSLKITDLIDDCSEKVFEHLDGRSLLNVAVANACLRKAAGVAYKRKFGKKVVCIEKNGYEISETPDSIRVCGLKKCLQFLRCLGSSISHLNINYGGWNEKECEHIHQYVNTYCVESLVKIEFSSRKNEIPIAHFEKPFVNVRTVKLAEDYLNNKFPLLLQWFPNARKLEFNCVYTHCWIPIDRSPLHHVEELRFDLHNIYLAHTFRGFFDTEAKWLLQLCRQTHSVEIDVPNRYGKPILKTVLYVINECRTIRNLKVNLNNNLVTVHRSEIQQIVDEHSSLVELVLEVFIFTTEKVLTLIRSLKSLKRFHFRIADRLQYDRLVAQMDNQWQPTLRDDDGNHVVTLERQN